MYRIKLTLFNKFYRQCFRLTWYLLCSWTPKFLNIWRILILRLFGAEIDVSATVYSSVKIWMPSNLKIGASSCLGPNVKIYNVSEVSIGFNTVISQDVEICTPSHDFTVPEFDLISENIVIGSNCWIAAGAFVGPGSEIESYVVIGARSVTVGHKLTKGVFAGNPAKKIKEKECIRYSF